MAADRDVQKVVKELIDGQKLLCYRDKDLTIGRLFYGYYDTGNKRS